MNFNLRILDSQSYYNHRMSHYYTGTYNEESNELISSLVSVTIYGEDFKDVKKRIRAEYKDTQDPRLEMVGSLRERFSQVEKKVLMMISNTDELIHRVYFHYNNKMSKPMIIVCVGYRKGGYVGIEQGRVIISGVDTVIEKNHFFFNNRCDYYECTWNYHTSRKGNYFINIDCTGRQHEKPLALRGKIVK